MSLNWPPNFPRTPDRDRTRNNNLDVTMSRAFSDLEKTLDRLGADDYDYEFDAQQRKKDKRPYANARPDDPSFVVRWSMDGEQFAVACDRYSRLRDNVRTVGMYLEEKRKMESRPVATGESEFSNARLPPADEEAVVAAPASQEPHEVLDVEPDAHREEVKTAYYALVQGRHSDKGGSRREFDELQEAKEAMLE
ncbi:J domain-containing protein [Haloferax namakaokahaiae]|uniref:J domain-containing protein n=1 Tax=Haloferax namakaokahaiae TaxID=1748331 RepID=A0ABD5ZCF5_9EURY